MKFYLSNANLFISGGDTTGEVKMLEIDNVKSNTEKYESLGMLFHQDVPVGLDQMAGKLTFAGISPTFFTEAVIISSSKLK